MDEAGIEASAVYNIATRAGQAENILRFCEELRSERLFPLASVHPDDEDAAGWIARAADAGLPGVKLHPQYQGFAVDDPRCEQIYSALQERQLLLALHCGRDFAFPDTDDRASVVRIAAVLDRHPRLRLIATHMGGWRSWQEVEQHLLGRDCFLETSFSLAELPAERAAEMIRRHGTHRVMFGSDWPWNPQKDELARVDALPLPPEEIEAIRYGNAAALLGIARSEEPAPR
jgi:hypothetical protein